MQPTTSTRKAFFIFCIVCFFLISCQGKEEKKETTTGGPAEITSPVQEGLTTGSLDTLYIERSAFDTIGKGNQLVFSFTFKNADSLTMHGWILKNGNRFDSLPNIKLKNHRASGLTYGVNRYFGNIVLTPRQYNKIKDALTDGMNFVLFAPFLQGNNIAYKIYVSDKMHGEKDALVVIVDTGAFANPSPPKVD